MKKIVKLVLLFLIAFLLFFLIKNLNNKTKVVSENNQNVLSEKVENSFYITKTNIQNYDVLISPQINGENIKLISNFEEKKTARQIFEENDCKLLTNAGFYVNKNNNNSPIGLFVVKNNLINFYQKNHLFNGIFYINNFRVPFISDIYEEDNFVYAFQSGPVLILNNQKTNLKYDQVKKSRRIILATTGDNKIILMALYSTKSVFEGPSLNELSTLVQQISDTKNLNISDAINLDGGSASAFVSDDYMLTEASLIGSAICII